MKNDQTTNVDTSTMWRKDFLLEVSFYRGQTCFNKSQICNDIYVRILTTRGQRGGFCVIVLLLLLQCAGFASILSPYKFIELNNLCILLYLHCISLKFDGCALNFLLHDFNQFLPLLLFWCSPISTGAVLQVLSPLQWPTAHVCR